MAKPYSKKEADAVYAKLREICLGFPGADEKLSHGMPSFHVRGKMFAHFVDSDYYDMPLSAWVKSTLEKQKELVRDDGKRFYVPKYVGPAGWVGVSLWPTQDWIPLTMLVEEAWLKVVPPKVATGEAAPPKVVKKAPVTRVTTDEKLAKASLDRLTKICEALPEVDHETESKHATFRIRKKPFVYFLDNHHGDRVISACVKGDPKANAKIIASDPKRFYLPAYIGRAGFLGIRLDAKNVDWKDIETRIGEAWKLQAPKTLVKATAAAPATKSGKRSTTTKSAKTATTKKAKRTS